MSSVCEACRAPSRICRLDGGLARRIRDEFGTPVYVVDVPGVQTRFAELLSAARSRYAGSQIALSYKTNSTRALLATLHAAGAWAEIISGDEWTIAQSLGVAGSQIVFNGPAKRDEEIRRALASGSFLHCDHADELDRIERIAQQRGSRARLGIRLHFDDQEDWRRFGFRTLDHADGSPAHQIADRILASPWLELGGIHVHQGTNIRDLGRFADMARRMSRFARWLQSQRGHELAWIDVGGGLSGIAPEIRERTMSPFCLPDAGDYCDAVIGPLLEYLESCRVKPILLFEPGRTLYSAFGGLLVSVVGRRPREEDQTDPVILDGGLTSMAFAWRNNYPIHVCTSNRPAVVHRFLGPTCMSLDQPHQPMPTPELSVGDLLVFCGVGCYSMAMASSFTHFRLGVLGWFGEGEVRWLRTPETIEHSMRLDVTAGEGGQA
jgi:diaminopimelate decarboxylase